MLKRTRDAVSTIKGYYFQFDYYILQLLQLQKDDDTVRIEGIEDVDVIISDCIKVVQCKYYDETNCTPSIVGKAIRPMLMHFAEHKDDATRYHYNLFGHYNSGQRSIEIPLTVEYIKQKFFTYTEHGEKHKLHSELKLADSDLENFLERITLELNADTYEDQIEKIISQLKLIMPCGEYEARYFYYNNALSFIKKISVNKSSEARTVSKKEFLRKIRVKQSLFDKWYIEYIGFEKFYRAVRKEFFTKMNISSAHRIFLVERDSNVQDSELVGLLMKISRNWSRLSKRETTPFCPYVYLHGISDSRLTKIKNFLLKNDFHIWDGYEYKDASFSAPSLARSVNCHIGVKCKIINELSQVQDVINACNGTKEIYQFYVEKPFYDRDTIMGGEFQIKNTCDVQKII